ncbi:hypothetical protein BT63DRAFT_422571 [Microthyrium microscopicum]|uniref:Uncharacterized protein n=1 Tax=Microthyrium microscopicum TaxID=703497 RepID=A0A6A6UK22_9PEZI|nr:hypothetical protein BT63DRAFT_422571 [Microthyrium microscopicum]
MLAKEYRRKELSKPSFIAWAPSDVPMAIFPSQNRLQGHLIVCFTIQAMNYTHRILNWHSTFSPIISIYLNLAYPAPPSNSIGHSTQ